MNRDTYIDLMEKIIDPRFSVDEREALAKVLVAESDGTTNRTTVLILGTMATLLVETNATRTGRSVDDVVRQYRGAMERNTYQGEDADD